MSSAQDKGNILEIAVQAIETAILRSSPTLKDNTFTIESKKRVSVSGVRHEIDLYVKFDLGPSYNPVFIFECKNLREAVSKNDIIVFSEKIDATQAQKGFFVAKSFSSDASAQARKDPRVELLIATEHEAAATILPFDFHQVIREREKGHVDVAFMDRKAKRGELDKEIDPSQEVTTLDGVSIDLKKYLDDWIEKSTEDRLKVFPSGTLDCGEYNLDCDGVRHFGPGTLLIGDHDIAEIKFILNFSVRVERPKIVSHFEVATRGRRILFAPVAIGTGTMQVALTALSNRQ